MVMADEDKAFGNRLLSLRKQRGWPQPELGKLIGTSGAIIGRYERGEITLELVECERILSVLDSLVRDAKARQTYRMSA
jgi:transcriptional regulator with XRE-family HTH domain